ncbi:plasmid pRiA4b ORF-3 family protein [Chitinophaga polysaccharea]|uniref:plasmid pRiA4b ORF-3 family protein n=1 Tax=Chitinophaga TaxID=79328 RepID=UPI00145586B3|nr:MULTISPECIES: plasmid pRiA4b ORF-3 family protein [Chitinophaga]NLR58810.1 plasmid pRiA4b ORF-3 family protein [Chitinophaga polysaccharea]NLU91343.1 plasmid pRiA4b ORF-3 family protein [Chitinophaga sp. Ak27]
MPVLKFRVYWEEDESVYRDIAIKPNQTFLVFHQAILQAFEFDSKHKATFFRSNDNWQRGREIILELDNQPRKAEPLLMADTMIAAAVKDPNQKFIYLYDFAKNWSFLVELIGVSKDENSKITYPACVRKEGLAPSQYGTKGLVGDKLVEMEEKYDLNKEGMDADGFGEEGEESDAMGGDSEEFGAEEESNF